ncbi:MAG: preprotein translocase subunit SecG [Pseudomonadota bacterium]|uniref:preprotein translocase subunit SecG n=1 Tax=Alteriqipengyuania lutimaris TaxID=1538146 RepID=UPI001CFE3375|nr:preprotein translocase subunit SecG [Alteriqipengyuania lutimaris]MEC8179832.1 preprotein translocase subunit SecG [Pseudomonadota bacterium]
MFLFLTVLQAIIAAALVGVILMQRSEGGGLGIGGGGSPGGMMSARGAADFLTRATRWLAVVFVVLSIVLASLAVNMTGTDSIESTLDRNVTPAAPADPLAQGGAAAPAAAPAQQGDAADQGEAADPLAGATE